MGRRKISGVEGMTEWRRNRHREEVKGIKDSNGQRRKIRVDVEGEERRKINGVERVRETKRKGHTE